jgi:very-short-patch-repair endonuclease
VNSSPQRHARPELALARLAAEQHGVVGMTQLRRLGLTKEDVAYRVRVGRVHPIFRGVYAVGHAALAQRGRFLAAVLAVGDGSALSRRAAAVLWQFWRWDGGAIDVRAPTQRRSRPGIRVHRGPIDPEDSTRRHGIPVTTPARTLLDLAPSLTQQALAHLVGLAEHARLVRVPSLKKDLDRWGPRPGTKHLRAVIAHGPAPTRSIMEARFLPLLDQHHLPRPEVNAKVLTYEVDGLYREQKLVIELDSHRWHDSPLAQAADRERTAALEAAGWRVIRFTSDELKHRPERALRRLRTALETRSARP